ncbi:MAG: HU family DNA-binding protein [Alphaproteobacteria bacterium]|jgi:nucleoid DNA-binding protein|nr:HU family DNA-binding protein [Alphaproteobacteria bacterium]
MNKTELVTAIAEGAELTKADATRALEATLEAVIETVAAGDKVSLIGFGTFQPSERKATTGRNPKTGEAIQIAAATLPKFKAGKAFKDRVNK